MNLKKRLLNYLIYLAIIFVLTIACLYVFMIPIYALLVLPLGIFIIINLILGKIILRTKIIFLIIPSIIVAVSSLYFAFYFANFIPFPAIDPYGINTAIIASALISVIIWELLYRLIISYTRSVKS